MLNKMLADVTEESLRKIYIVEYFHKDVDGRRLKTCKVCSLAEFLRELTEYTELEIAQIIKSVKFKTFNLEVK